jgi:DNA-binding MurR/RpiR family transcriptional regulator
MYNVSVSEPPIAKPVANYPADRPKAGSEMAVSVRQTILQEYQRLTPSERRIADLILHRPWRVVDLTVQRLARDASVGTSVISRLSRRLGLADYRGLRLALARELGEDAARSAAEKLASRSSAAGADPLWLAAVDTAESDLEAVRRSLDALDPASLTEAAETLGRAARVVVAGGGDSSGSIAKRFARMLIRQGWRARAEADPRDTTWTEDIDPGDAVLLVSHRGNSPELCEALPGIRERGARIVALTNAPDGPIAQAADVVVATAVPGGTDDVAYVLDPVFPVQVVTARALAAAAVAARLRLASL